MRKWYMTTATIDGRVGGSVDMIAGPLRFHWTGRIAAWEPPRVFEYEWNIDLPYFSSIHSMYSITLLSGSWM